MNLKNLAKVFDNYIQKFEFINNAENNESYKWSAVLEYQKAFDLDAEDFVAVLKKAKQASGNLIDSQVQPFGGLVVMAEKNGEAETIREMFRNLYAEDNGDLDVIQKKIDSFLASCDALLDKHYPGSHLYANDQRTAMGYLWLYNPDKYFFCKTTQAQYLAKCIEFYDSWGTYANFSLPVFYRFCNVLLDAIKGNQQLLDTHRSRFECAEKEMHPDTEYHILLVDIIFCSQIYGLYDGVTIQERSSSEIKLYLERKAKAADFLAKVQSAEETVSLLHEARAIFDGWLTAGATVRHKAWGEAIYKGTNKGYLSFYFPKIDDTKTFMLSSFANGFLTIDTPEYREVMEKYHTAIAIDLRAYNNLESAKKALQPYEEYLD